MTNIMQIFLKALNLSISASYLIIAIIAARLILKRAPKALYCVLWLLVAIRLVFPFSIESAFSLVPAAQPIAPDIIYEGAPHINTGDQIVDTPVNNYLQQNMAPQPEYSATPMQTAIAIASYIWIIGIAIMCAYLIFTTLRLKHKVCDAVPYELDGGRIYRTDAIGTPFLLGLANPRIYVPYGIDEDTLKYVALHENAHKKRRDHLIKPIAYLLLSVYWFNPVIWIAYCLLCRDIELACDEKVIRRLGADNRCAYSEALLACSVSRKTIAACPIAFGEVGIKARIKNILDYKKPTFWIIAAAVAVCVIVPVCFMTQKKNDTAVSGTVSIDDSEIFKLTLPADLAERLLWKTEDGKNLVFYESSGKYEIGRMEAVLEDDIYSRFNKDANPDAKECYTIGSYGKNNKIETLVNTSHTTHEYYYNEPESNAEAPSYEIPAEGIAEFYEGTVDAGTVLIPNADGTHTPEKLPNAGEEFKGERVEKDEDSTGTAETDTNTETEYIIEDNSSNSIIHEGKAEFVPNEPLTYEYCYLFIPQKSDAWGDELAEECVALQTELISLLGTVTVNELVATDTLVTAETSAESTDTKSIQQSQIEKWATAFCARNGAVIAEMADEAVCAQFGEKELLIKGTNEDGSSYASFGWSSPWPWEQEGSYRIINLTDSAATILYYAWTSDPHVTVWREELGFETKNDNIVIKSENLEILDAICTSEEFYEAYPDGIINGTAMDYTANGAGESLKSSIIESKLRHPAEAAKNLLNILDNPNKVDATTVYYDDIENSAKVTFTFKLDHKSVSVKMIQPYGKDSIWVPQTDAPIGDRFISGVVNTDVIEVRKTPSETAEVIGILPEGRLVTFEMLSEDGDFYKISTENDGETIEGYVKKEYIDK